jgi:hypothetical protein
MTTLNEKTKIPLAWLITAIVFLSSAAYGVGSLISSLSSRVEASEQMIDRQAAAIKADRETLVEMRVDIATIKETVLYLKDHRK